jgi:hypothetical protein
VLGGVAVAGGLYALKAWEDMENACGAEPNWSAITPANLGTCSASARSELDRAIAYCECKTDEAMCGSAAYYRQLAAECGWQ